jgi:hypothetical protein
MKKSKIVRKLQWGMGGMLVLLLGVASVLLPLGAQTARAASVQIKDDAGVLNVEQVQRNASALSHPVSISTLPTFDRPKSDFVKRTEQTLTGQDAIALGISVEQRYLAIVAGKAVGLNAEQMAQACQAFAQAYGGNAGANGDYTAATIASLESLQSSLRSGDGSGIAEAPQGGGGVFGSPLTWLLLWVLLGISFTVLSCLFRPRKAARPPAEIPWQAMPGPKDEYGRIALDPGHESRGYGRSPSYGPGYDPYGYDGRPVYGPVYPTRGGIGPWAAGGLGALGGGFLGYELGRMAGEHDHQVQGDDAVHPDALAPLAHNGLDPGMNDPAGAFANSPDFGGESADFGGGDFGGGSEWL